MTQRSGAPRAGTKKVRRPSATTTPAQTVVSSGRKRKRSKSSVPASYNVDDLIAAVTPLLELFAVCDDVFTEDEALTTARKVSLGRIYEQWQKTRLYFDPSFVAAEHRRPRRWKQRGSKSD